MRTVPINQIEVHGLYKRLLDNDSDLDLTTFRTGNKLENFVVNNPGFRNVRDYARSITEGQISLRKELYDGVVALVQANSFAYEDQPTLQNIPN